MERKKESMSLHVYIVYFIISYLHFVGLKKNNFLYLI